MHRTAPTYRGRYLSKKMLPRSHAHYCNLLPVFSFLWPNTRLHLSTPLVHVLETPLHIQWVSLWGRKQKLWTGLLTTEKIWNLILTMAPTMHISQCLKKQHDISKLFFLCLPLHNVHAPFEVPKQQIDLYPEGSTCEFWRTQWLSLLNTIVFHVMTFFHY